MPAPTNSPLMQSLLDVAALFITPDWNALLLLIPIGLALLFVAWFLFTLRKFATVGPNRRAPARIEPLTPAHVHMPGGSAAPILVAFGAGALFLGLVVGGIGLWVGITILVLTMLVWFREGMRDYDHLEAAQTLPAVIHEGPPPGVHMPGPSIRPLLGALGSAALLGGLVVGGWVLILAVVFLVYTLIGWLIDFTAEYRKVEEADRTGHLENIPERRLPIRTLQVFAVLFALLGLNQLGVFPPTSPAAGGGPGASPGASGAPSSAGPGGAPGASPGASGAPSSAGPGGAPGGLVVVAKNIAYDKHELTAPANAPFSIEFKNEDDATLTHDVDIRKLDTSIVADQKPIPGGKSVTYTYQPLPAGTYQYFCSVHPGVAWMTGTLTVQ